MERTVADVRRRVPPVYMRGWSQYYKELVLLPSQYNNVVCDVMVFLMDKDASKLELTLTVEDAVQFRVQRTEIPTNDNPPPFHVLMQESMDVPEETVATNNIMQLIDAVKSMALRTYTPSLNPVATLETSAASFTEALMGVRMLQGDQYEVWKAEQKLRTVMAEIAKMMDDVDRGWKLREDDGAHDDMDYTATNAEQV